MTASRVVIYGTLLGIGLHMFLFGPYVLFALLGVFTYPIPFVAVYGSLTLLMYLENFLLRKFSGKKPLRFIAGPFLIIALVTFFFLSILIPQF